MLSLVDISKYYRSNDNIAVGLHKINLDFEIGDFVVVTGESGGGKSTLLNVISGSLAYDDGELYFEGRETSWYGEMEWEDYRKEKIGFVYQDYHLIDSFSCVENIKTAIFILHPDMNEKLAKEKAMHYLEQVGLEKQAEKRAAQLSSGQKQRLAIARALAKETDIIVADEPTGNLDVENSVQIIKILSGLSQNKLVIMVTHNYEEAQPFATRKIRMYNGEVAEDIRLKPNQYEGKKKEAKQAVQKKVFPEKRKQERLLARKMIKNVRRAKIYSMLILFLLFLFLSAAVYVFFGSFKKSLDYSTAKDYSDRTYVNTDKTRLSVRKADRKAMTEEDVKKLQAFRHVEYVDLYDTVNDIIYAGEQGKDYIVTSRLDMQIVSIQDESKTIKSVSGMSEDDILSGRMPQDRNEAVVASEDETLIGQSMDIYLNRKYEWDGDCIHVELVITGITNKGEEGQLYISNPLAEQLNTVVRRLSDYCIYAVYAEDGHGLSEMEWSLEEISEEKLKPHAKETQHNPIFLKNDNLSEFQIYVSENFILGAGTLPEDGFPIPKKIYRTAYLFWGLPYHREGLALEVQETQTKHGIHVIEVSNELFDSIYSDQNSYQVSVYMTDYAYTDRVIAALEQEGYEAVSVFRAAGTDYNSDKVNEQTLLLILSFAALIAVFLAGIFLIRLIINGRKKDYSVMMLIGMKRSVINRMNLLDIICHTAGALIGTVLIANLAMYYRIPYIVSAVRYYEIWDYLVFAMIMYSMAAVLYRKLRYRI